MNRVQGDHALYLDMMILRCFEMEISGDGDIT